MSATSGPPSRQPLAFYDPDSCSWRTSQGTLDLGSTPSSPTLPVSGSMRSGVLYEHPMSAPATNVPGSLSLLRTPTASVTEAKDGIKLSGRSPSDPQVGLVDQVRALLPTPVAQDDQKSPAAHVAAKNRYDDSERTQITSLTVLARQAAATGRWSDKLLPTPRTTDANGAGSHGEGGDDQRTVVKMLPTPTANDGKGSRNTTAQRTRGSRHPGDTLTDAVVLLPTPTAQNSHGNGQNNRKEPTLVGVARLLGASTSPPSDDTSSSSVDPLPLPLMTEDD